MASEPVIVPPTPTVTQGQPIPDSPEQIASTAKNVQDIFDRIAPAIKTAPTPAQPQAQPPEPPPPQARTPVETPPAPQETTPASQPEPTKLPSFIEKALDIPAEPPKPGEPAAPTVEEWPEELPELKTEQSKSNWKKFRGEYQKLKEELGTLRNRPPVDDQTRERMEFLENRNKELDAHVQRFSVETHQDFQQNIIRPMHMAWQEAAKIVQEAGGNPDDLAKALTLSGKPHFEALDEIFRDLPESAKAEAQPAIAAYRRIDETRKAALANAPRTMQELRKRDLERQQDYLQKQKKGMEQLFDEAVRVLRDEARVEILQTSSDPDAKAWNDQAENLVSASRKLYLDNTDLKRMAMACVLAPMADTYRKLWLQERAARLKTDQVQNDRYGSEPTLSESGGNARGQAPNLQDDLKKPFKDVFLREFHKARERGVS
jgi:hypothetical protein